jgi:uncharacterized surface protein with fasciclin (FAS1) repeats
MIYGLTAILLPPPPMGFIINHFPTVFSTLILGLERSGLGESLKDTPHAGGTFFAPSNAAFKKLGPRVNAFLFSKPGAKFLKALLEYHVVANRTLYSTTFYDGTSNSTSSDGSLFPFEKHHCHSSKERTSRQDEHDRLQEKRFPMRHIHIDLPTLLDNHPLPVDIIRRGPWIDFKVNHFVRVAHQDGLAKDGVIQLVNTVLIPPRRPHQVNAKAEHLQNEELTVEDFKERFTGVVQDDEVDDSSATKLVSQTSINWEL